jgi:hypothetical protein
VTSLREIELPPTQMLRRDVTAGRKSDEWTQIENGSLEFGIETSSLPALSRSTEEEKVRRKN